jgi:acetyl esterase/lipase
MGMKRAAHCIATCAVLGLSLAGSPSGASEATQSDIPQPVTAVPGPPPLFEPPLPTVNSTPRIQYPHRVVGLRDVTYKVVPGYRPLKLDLYVPSNTRVQHPAIVWIHGGGWEIGNPRADWTYGDWTQVLAKLAARGYVIAAITYRFSHEAKFPAAIQDVKDAIRFVRKHAGLYGVDPSRVAAWGLSAGGHLAALAGTSCHADALNAGTADPDTSSCLQAVVDWFGSTDFNLGTLGPAARAVADFMGCDPSHCASELLATGSPVSYVEDDAPPFLIMQGSVDPIVPPAQSQTLADALKAHGNEVQLIIYPGLGHGFTGATGAQEQQILQTTFDFFDEKLAHNAALPRNPLR